MRKAVDMEKYLGAPRVTNYIEMLCGLTPWCFTSTMAPPYLGWWRTWSESGRTERRWWNGYVWSVPAPTFLDAAYEQLIAETPAPRNSGTILWCGLGMKHPAGYLEYNLVASPRTRHWGTIHRRK